METRLGDIIDDFCIKCKRITNHAVVSMLGAEAAKVRCRTCYSDHDYRHEQAPPPKVDPRKLAAYNAVAAKMNLPPADSAPAPEAAPEPGPESPIEPVIGSGIQTVEESAEPVVEPPATAAPKAKRARK